MTDTSLHPSPYRDRANPWMLTFAVAAPALFWIVQGLAGYWTSSAACYAGDHPAPQPWVGALETVFPVLDAVSLLGALVAGGVCYMFWRRVRHEKKGGHEHTQEIGEGRTRFMAIWGLLSAICFGTAILFNIIATVAVPSCAG